MGNRLENYCKARHELLSYFGYEGYAENIDDLTDMRWRLEEDDRRVCWGEEEPEVYSEDTRAVVRKPDFTLMRLYYCTGDYGLAIFDTDKEVR